MKVLLLIVLVVIFVTLILNSRQSNFDSIPKIIHQIAMSKLQHEDTWPTSWKTSQETWKTHFPDFEYKLWNDRDAENLIVSEYPWFYDTYKGYKEDIKRIDAIRYFFLYHYGGMYVDMDMECTANFWDQIPSNKVSVVENPWPKWMFWKARLQNSLMISPKEHKIWKKAWRELEDRKNEPDVLDATGPKLIESLYLKNPDVFNILEKGSFIQSNSLTYNPLIKIDPDDNICVEHNASASWGSGPLNELYKSIKS
jgi:mannosyltransferase OCH1-like enzyme